MRKKLPTLDKVWGTVRRLLNPTTLGVSRLRNTLVGVLMTVGLAEVCAFRLLRHHIVAGDLPAYTADGLIVGYYLLEACLAPLVSWWGYRKRRLVFIIWSAVLTASLVTWFVMQTPGERETDLCVPSVPSSGSSPARLLVLLASAPVLVAARAAVASHGVAYIEDHAPDRIPLHYSIFVLSRILPLLVGMGLVPLLDKSLPLQVTLFLVGMVVNVLQLFAIVPKQDPEVEGEVKLPPPMNDRGLSASVNRVVRNQLVTSQVLAASLLAAALWCYGYYRNDVIKVKYNMAVTRSNLSNFTEMLQYAFLICYVAYTGVHLSQPLWTRFSRTGAVRSALTKGVVALVVLVLMMTMSSCQPGGGGVAGERNCSSQCGCSGRYVEFAPVCVLDDFTTYASPCHAGCSELEVVDGLSVYVNCTCGSRAVTGACSAVADGAGSCRAAYDLHQMLFVALVAITISGISTHGAVALRAADARDRAVALGVGGAVVALVLAATHTYLAVATAGMTCSLYAGGVCVLPSAGLPRLVGVSGVVLLLLSSLLSTFVWLRLRRCKRTDANI